MRKIRKKKKNNEALELLKYVQELDKLAKRHREFENKHKNIESTLEALEVMDKGLEFERELRALEERFDR
jgi:hypothetical protein